jgi:hypothetical protein
MFADLDEVLFTAASVTTLGDEVTAPDGEQNVTKGVQTPAVPTDLVFHFSTSPSAQEILLSCGPRSSHQQIATLLQIFSGCASPQSRAPRREIKTPKTAAKFSTPQTPVIPIELKMSAVTVDRVLFYVLEKVFITKILLVHLL